MDDPLNPVEKPLSTNELNPVEKPLSTNENLAGVVMASIGAGILCLQSAPLVSLNSILPVWMFFKGSFHAGFINLCGVLWISTFFFFFLAKLADGRFDPNEYLLIILCILIYLIEHPRPTESYEGRNEFNQRLPGRVVLAIFLLIELSGIWSTAVNGDY